MALGLARGGGSHEWPGRRSLRSALAAVALCGRSVPGDSRLPSVSESIDTAIGRGDRPSASGSFPALRPADFCRPAPGLENIPARLGRARLDGRSVAAGRGARRASHSPRCSTKQTSDTGRRVERARVAIRLGAGAVREAIKDTHRAGRASWPRRPVEPDLSRDVQPSVAPPRRPSAR